MKAGRRDGGEKGEGGKEEESWREREMGGERREREGMRREGEKEKGREKVGGEESWRRDIAREKGDGRKVENWRKGHSQTDRHKPRYIKKREENKEHTEKPNRDI